MVKEFKEFKEKEFGRFLNGVCFTETLTAMNSFYAAFM
jgi:hypothetical protein